MTTQSPDTQPGNYYVSLIRDKKTALLAGPFVNNHAAALAMVQQAKDAAYEADPMTWWDAIGTARMPLDYTVPGKLNAMLGL